MINRRYKHYFRHCPYSEIDVYRVLKLFDVTDPCLQHAIKKLLVAGGRGIKDAEKDVSEAIVTLQRWQEMRGEEKQITRQQEAAAEAKRFIIGGVAPAVPETMAQQYIGKL